MTSDGGKHDCIFKIVERQKNKFIKTKPWV